MRQAFCDGMMREQSRKEIVFLTGDLGFRALEPLRDAMGPRFINAGVAEQNMVSVAAGLARLGLRPWVYSIAPFVFARPFEQIRNDICLHNLPVVLVGNGGGYGYGVMGSTHHALEDYGVLLTLSGMQVLIPAFDNDLSTLIPCLFESKSPTYLRLGQGEQPQAWTTSPFSPWRKLVSGQGGTLIAVGPLAGSLWAACAEKPESVRPNLWCLSQLPLSKLPEELLSDLEKSSRVTIAEEHVAHGSAGHSLSMALLQRQCNPASLRHFTALGYPSGRFGSQKFHRAECGLDPASLLGTFELKAAR
jgi:transketolase